MAQRPAPIMVSLLIFPGTSGARWVDYLVADRLVAPPEHAGYYSEKLVFMPNSYQVRVRPIPLITCARYSPRLAVRAQYLQTQAPD